MSTGVIVVIVIIAIVVVALAAWQTVGERRRRLRQRFGPEYDRLVEERGSKRAADTELAQRQRHIAKLDLRPLSAEDRARYGAQWTAVQEDFVERPREALKAATGLVTAVLQNRGYPAEDYSQILVDLSVDHARTLEDFRKAHDISVRADSGSASTEDMRQAMIWYRAVFQDVAEIHPDGEGDRPAIEPDAGHAAAASPAEPADSPAEPAGAPGDHDPHAAALPGDEAAQRPDTARSNQGR